MQFRQWQMRYMPFGNPVMCMEDEVENVAPAVPAASAVGGPGVATSAVLASSPPSAPEKELQGGDESMT